MASLAEGYWVMASTLNLVHEITSHFNGTARVSFRFRPDVCEHIFGIINHAESCYHLAVNGSSTYKFRTPDLSEKSGRSI